MKIKISRLAEKQLAKIPDHIRRKFEYWCSLIRYVGMREVRQHRSIHDEPLKGERAGQRSIRLSKSYRVIYREMSEEMIEILEVNKHEY